MTQFMLCVPGRTDAVSQIAFRSISNDEEWLSEVARALFPNERTVRVPYMKSGQSIHELFTEAHDALYNGRNLNSTRLLSVLPEMMSGCQRFILWWGNDWCDLAIVDTEQALVSALIDQLREPAGEVYLRWEQRS